MNGKPRDMDYKFAIKVLSGTKVDTQSMHRNPKKYGYQNQYFYDIARQMAIQALKEKYENDKPQTPADVVALPCNVGDTVYPLNADRRFRAFIERIVITTEGLEFEWVQYDVGVDCTECWDDGLFTIDDIGKTVFLDETEYLVALKEQKMKNQSKLNEVIDTIINTPTKAPSKEEAAEILRACGVLDKDNNLNPAYREIIKSEQDKKYIEVDAFAEATCNFQHIDEDAANNMIWLLRTFPTADVVAVIRCKKCGNYCENTGECNMYGHHPGEDGYCSGAIPKESEKNEV